MPDDLARRDLPVPRRDGTHIVSCTLTITNEIREKDQRWSDPSPWQEYEPTWRRFRTFEAEIAFDGDDGLIVPVELLLRPSVFDWPDRRMYVAMQVTCIDTSMPLGGNILMRVRGTVLGIAEYGATRIDEPEARRRLRLPPKQLTG